MWRIVVGRGLFTYGSDDINEPDWPHDIDEVYPTWMEAQARMLDTLLGRSQTDSCLECASYAAEQHQELSLIDAPQEWIGNVDGDDWVIIQTEGTVNDEASVSTKESN
jgi:hypothetical protein